MRADDVERERERERERVRLRETKGSCRHAGRQAGRQAETDGDAGGRVQAAIPSDRVHLLHPGPFLLRSVNKTVICAGMEVSAGDLLFADGDGLCKIPVERAAEIVKCAGEIRRWESEVFEYFQSADYDPEQAGPVLAEIQKKFVSAA